MGINPNVEKWRPLVAKYFPPDQVENALRTMGGESGGDPRAHATKGENSRGLFQINLNAHPQLVNVNLFDPETNVRVAAQMQKEQGWQPWSAARQLGIAGTTPLPGSGTGERKMAEPEPQLFPGEKWQTNEWNQSTDENGDQYAERTTDAGRTVRYKWDPQRADWVFAGEDWNKDTYGVWSSEQKREKPSASNETSQWSIQTKADGSKWRVNEITNQSEPVPGFGPTPTLNTTARYLPKQGANAQYDVGSSDYAGNAPPGWERNVNFDEEAAAQDKAYQAARIADLQRSAEGSPTAWATLRQAQKQFDQKMAWDRTLAEMKAKQDQEQADRTLQGQLYNHINNIWAQNLPRMGDPSQTYFAGTGPGGPLETLYKQGGSSYDPNQGKINWQNFDPNAAWKQAAGMVRR